MCPHGGTVQVVADELEGARRRRRSADREPTRSRSPAARSRSRPTSADPESLRHRAVDRRRHARQGRRRADPQPDRASGLCLSAAAGPAGPVVVVSTQTRAQSSVSDHERAVHQHPLSRRRRRRPGPAGRGARLRAARRAADPPGAVHDARASGSTGPTSAAACGAWSSRRTATSAATLAQVTVFQALEDAGSTR